MYNNKHYNINIQNKSGHTEQNSPIKIALKTINELQRVEGKSKTKKMNFIPMEDDRVSEEFDLVVVNLFLKTTGPHPI